jgi:hypothetical protein
VHAAHRRLVYEAVGPLRRRALHADVARSLEAGYGDRASAVAARLATHFEAAGDALRALRYFTRASAEAEKRFAYREAAAYLRSALAQLDGREELEPFDPGCAFDRDAVAGDLHCRLAALLVLFDGYSSDEVRGAYAAAERHFAVTGSALGTFTAVSGLARHELTRARYEAARPYLARIAEIAASELPLFAPVASLWAGFAAAGCGELHLSRAHLEKAASATAHPDFPVQDIHRLSRSLLALVVTLMGDVDGGRAYAEDALDRSRRDGRPAELVHASVLATERAVFVRDRSTGRAHAAVAASIAEENGFLSFLAFSRFYDAWLDDERPAAQRVGIMRAALADRRRVGDRWHEPMLLGLMAETQLSGADVEGARASLDEAVARMEATCERYFEAELYRLRGEWELLAGRGVEPALRWLRRAVDAALRSGAQLFAARAASRLEALTAP